MEQTSFFEEPDSYSLFVDKFKHKKTTDDCYTPPHIYDAVLKWAVSEYGLETREIVRPFYPGGDFEHFPYPDKCVVVDNPPFSILSRIVSWFDEHSIDYFLFAPALTLFNTARGRTNAIIADSSIVYANGAIVKTAFLTNMGCYRIHVSADLHACIERAKAAAKQNTPSLPKYVYPENVLTAATIQKICKHGVSLRIPADECTFISALDSQRASKKTIFGGGMLLSHRAAAEKAAAEKAAARVFELSPRELLICDALSKNSRGE